MQESCTYFDRCQFYRLTVITLMLCNFENILQADKPHYLDIKKL